MISNEKLVEIADMEMGEGGLFVYDTEAMTDELEHLQWWSRQIPYGMTIRYAAKANPHSSIIDLFDEKALKFDASSVQEAHNISANTDVSPHRISLSSQVLRDSKMLRDLMKDGLSPVATSLRQIHMLGEIGLNDSIAVRMNPGEGSGHSKRVTVGGSASSFGIWKEQLPEVLDTAERTGVRVDRIHTHIGSGVDSGVWRDTIVRSLGIVEECPDVKTLDIGGGFKVARMPDEESTHIPSVFRIFGEELRGFAERTGREIHLEVEPGSLLVANAGTLLGRIEEVVSTDVYDFLRLNVGMNAIMRPALYGAQHPIEVLPRLEKRIGPWKDYVVVGPCCESGDILTPTPGNPEEIQPRRLQEASVGDYVAIRGAGAYCASMSASQYNHIPPADEMVI
jgi:diaminopimelate decarboxylase